jgi:hypothetical protein
LLKWTMPQSVFGPHAPTILGRSGVLTVSLTGRTTPNQIRIATKNVHSSDQSHNDAQA